MNENVNSDNIIWDIIFIIGMIVFCIIGIGMIATLVYYIATSNHNTTIGIPVGFPIERAVEVSELENKFVHVQNVGFGGAGAGGLGAPIIHINNPEQFINLLAGDEPIYVSVNPVFRGSLPVHTRRCSVRYWAFIENRAGIIQYEEIYEVPSELGRFHYHSFHNGDCLFRTVQRRRNAIEEIHKWAITEGFVIYE